MILLSSFLFILLLSYQQAPLRIWTLAGAVWLLLLSRLTSLSFLSLVVAWTVFLVIVIGLNFRGLRRKLISQYILAVYRRLLPPISDTEQQALEAGSVGFESQLFQGRIDWPKHFHTPLAQLTAKEQAFLDGPVAQLCQQIDDWRICHELHDLPSNLWAFLKEHGFFGLVIPEAYGGKGFSALAHSEILMRLYSRSTTVATTVAVPNSLGPAELLLHYGTEAQKNYYLPRLAQGIELPCFALTSLDAGSDASAMPDYGVVCHGQWQGQETLGIRLNWRKRYITLAPVATVLGLAFKLFDPDGLLSPQKERGICCALIPVSTPGIDIGRRHIPLDIPFQNGPTQGQEVFIPLSYLIGGEAMIGQGWRMLVDCLSVGRAITLPTSAISGSKLFAATSGAYARIRRQFNTAIGDFEGIQQPLARLARTAYLFDAARLLSLSAIDRGEKPAVVSAMMKYYATEAGRMAACDAMDIHGGKGICLGPNNYLARFYQGAPIAITVEGANILTRNLIIFGQGAVRCHPYLLKEWQAAQDSDKKTALKAFDHVFFAHLGYSLSNISRSLLLSLSFGTLARVPGPSVIKRYGQKIHRLSANFALAADSILWVLGSQLKRQEALSARLADVFSYLYFTAATLKRFQHDGVLKEDQALVEYTCQYLLHQAEQQLWAVIHNLPIRWLKISLHLCIFPLGRQCAAPTDDLHHQIGRLLLQPSATRQRICQGIDQTPSAHNPMADLEALWLEVIRHEPLEKRLKQAIRQQRVSGWTYPQQIDQAVQSGIITRDEASSLQQLHQQRLAVLNVDDFDGHWH